MRTLNLVGSIAAPSPVTHYSSQDFTATYTTVSGIAITGAPFTVDNSECNVVYIKYKPASTGQWKSPLVNGMDGVSIDAVSNVINVAGVSPAPFAASDVYEIGIQYQVKGYSSPLDAGKAIILNPDSENYIGETLAAITNGADNTYYYYVDMSGYRKVGFQLILNGGSGTVSGTVEATIQDDGTAAASCTYEDVTSDTFGSVSYTSSAMLIDNAEKLACFKYVRLKIRAGTGGANDADWTIYAKRLF